MQGGKDLAMDEENKPDEAANTSNWLQDSLRPFNFISAMRERRQIRRVCVNTLKHYRQAEAEMPQASHEELYARVIEQSSGGADPSALREIMRRAKESFATWPVERPLALRDVAQYIVVTDCLRNDLAVTGVRSRVVDLALVIAAEVIPANL
jgi:hypothetical protein